MVNTVAAFEAVIKSIATQSTVILGDAGAQRAPSISAE